MQTRKTETNNAIVGKWKLVEIKTFSRSGETSKYYSNENIIYNFKSDGKVAVSDKDNTVHASGSHKYFFREDYLGANTDPKIILVKINGSKFTYEYSTKDKKMTLGKSYIDGNNLVFKKL